MYPAAASARFASIIGGVIRQPENGSVGDGISRGAHQYRRAAKPRVSRGIGGVWRQRTLRGIREGRRKSAFMQLCCLA